MRDGTSLCRKVNTFVASLFFLRAVFLVTALAGIEQVTQLGLHRSRAGLGCRGHSHRRLFQGTRLAFKSCPVGPYRRFRPAAADAAVVLEC